MNTSTSPSTREALSLENCDKEPVHIPGRVQGFGLLIAMDQRMKRITWCSGNSDSLAGIQPKQIFETKPVDLFGRKTLHDISNALSLSTSRTQREHLGTVTLAESIFDASVHLCGDNPIIELEALVEQEAEIEPTLKSIRALLSRLNESDDLSRCLNDTVTGLRALTGFDRVMAYRFDPSGDGEVLAEACGAELEPLLGLRFPKWDIPNQVRSIMVQQPLRIIADVDADEAPLLSADDQAPSLDLTLSITRGVSPIHIEYLRNMGVAASMTLSIVVRGRLWGLLAFHHGAKRRISTAARSAAEIFTQFFCLQLEQRLERTRDTYRSAALSQQRRLMEACDEATHFGELVGIVSEAYCGLVGADGLALISPDDIALHGQCPDREVTERLSKIFPISEDDDYSAITSLVQHPALAGSDLGSIAGAVVVRLGSEDERKLAFFRREATQSINWAGAPDKEIVDRDDGPRLLPRGSFQAYVQSVDGHCLPWEEEAIDAALAAGNALAKADNALHRRLSQKAERQRSLYIAELNHRVRNILALIRSLSRRAQESSHSLESYAKALEQRIAALGTAHNLAAQMATDSVSLHTVFLTEADPYLREGNDDFELLGADFAVRGDLAPIFALVVHELMTNSIKHGSLSVPTGKVRVEIAPAHGGVSIVWKEKGGPATSIPTRRGFGLGLIERAIPYEMDGDSSVEFAPQGMIARLWLPRNAIKRLDSQLPTPDPTKSSNVTVRSDDNIPRDVLVVEDSMMVAMDLTDMLRKLGVANVRTSATVGQAIQSIDMARPDFAILDITLRLENSFAVARRLQEKNVPFVFVTGYGSDYEMPEDLSQHIIMTKPLDTSVLNDAIFRLYSQD